MLLVVDNHDSFTWNLVHSLARFASDVHVVQCDEVELAEVVRLSPRGIVLSPGPGRPEAAGVSMAIVRELGPRVPLLGVCLGHQVVCAALGARVSHAERLMHGRTSPIQHDGLGLFVGLPQQLLVARYHSLIVEPHSLPPELLASAFTDRGELMAVRHQSWPTESVQFHPESFMTEGGSSMVQRFVERLPPCAEASGSARVRRANTCAVTSSPPFDHLARIVERKQHEVARRLQHAATFVRLAEAAPLPRPDLLAPLRRAGAAGPKVIAEIKLRSPSAGTIRDRVAGELPAIALGYQHGGAAAVSVLCDGPGFGGCPLDVRRVSARVQLPVLFKEFVVDPVQVDLARAVGASYVLLLVRVLNDRELARLIREVRARGLEPVVEAADTDELTRALATDAAIVGINARDLRSFEVDPGRAGALVDCIPSDRVAVFMSGVRSAEDYRKVAHTRADAVLIGEGLMRARDPGQKLSELLAST